jgi:hypothetical protein
VDALQTLLHGYSEPYASSIRSLDILTHFMLQPARIGMGSLDTGRATTGRVWVPGQTPGDLRVSVKKKPKETGSDVMDYCRTTLKIRPELFDT